MLTDATSRNSLYKIHVSLGKIVNSLDDQQQPVAGLASRSFSVATDNEEKTVIDPSRIEKEEEVDDDGDATVTAILKKESPERSSFNTTITDDRDRTAVRHNS